MTEILHNAWVIARFLLLVAYTLAILASLVAVPSILGGAPGRLKLLTLPAVVAFVFLSACVPLVARTLGFQGLAH